MNSNFQPIIIDADQYKELLRAASMYAIVKGKPELFDRLANEGTKFGFKNIKVDDEVFLALEDYVEEESWQFLAHALAHRDIKRTMKNEESDTFMDACGHRTLAYLKEFEKNGVDNLISLHKM